MSKCVLFFLGVFGSWLAGYVLRSAAVELRTSGLDEPVLLLPIIPPSVC